MECEDSQEDEYEVENIVQNDDDSDEAAGDGEWEDEDMSDENNAPMK